MSFEFTPLRIPEVVLITPRVWRDERGVFAEVYKASAFEIQGVQVIFKQVNQSVSRQNVLRGLHYQLPPATQGKLVTLATGRVYDVAVDIRVGSPTYGQWAGVELTAEARTSVWVPPGFAHGFCTLSEEAQMIYYCTEEYAPEQERGIIWNDPAVKIEWPIETPILAPRDAQYPILAETENPFIYQA